MELEHVLATVKRDFEQCQAALRAERSKVERQDRLIMELRQEIRVLQDARVADRERAIGPAHGLDVGTQSGGSAREEAPGSSTYGGV